MFCSHIGHLLLFFVFGNFFLTFRVLSLALGFSSRSSCTTSASGTNGRATTFTAAATSWSAFTFGSLIKKNMFKTLFLLYVLCVTQLTSLSASETSDSSSESEFLLRALRAGRPRAPRVAAAAALRPFAPSESELPEGLYYMQKNILIYIKFLFQFV